MYIKVKDLDLTKEPKNQNVYLLQGYPYKDFYISRARIGQHEHKFLNESQQEAIVYFNRQAAEQAQYFDKKANEYLLKLFSH